MNAKEKIVQTVNDGVNVINEKLEQQKAAARKRERRKKAKKAFRTAVNILVIPVVLLGLFWMGAELLVDYQMELLPFSAGWTLLFIAAAVMSMITCRLIPVKLGVILLCLCVLVRSNSWLFGVLDTIPLYYIAAAVAVLVVLIYVVVAIDRAKNGVKRQWSKTKKAVTKKVENIRSKVTKSK